MAERRIRVEAPDSPDAPDPHSVRRSWCWASASLDPYGTRDAPVHASLAPTIAARRTKSSVTTEMRRTSKLQKIEVPSDFASV